MLLGVLTALVTPRLLARADWADREPVLALWVWLGVPAWWWPCWCAALAMTLSAAVAWQAVRGQVFAPAPHDVVEAYTLGTAAGPWAATTRVAPACGAVWSAAMLVREVVRALARRRLRRAELLVRAPLLPGEEPGSRLVVLEGERSDAWWLSGGTPRLVVTTAALRRLKGRQPDALVAHEEGTPRPGTTGCCTARPR